MKGPVAKAGSIMYLFNNSGIIVTSTAAKIITVNYDKLTTNPSLTVAKTQAIPKIILANSIPFNTSTDASFKIFERNFPKCLSPLAYDCTTIAEDCIPTFPPIAVINGIKNASAGICVILP